MWVKDRTTGARYVWGRDSPLQTGKVRGGKRFAAMPVRHGVCYLMEGVERLGHPQHSLATTDRKADMPQALALTMRFCSAAFARQLASSLLPACALEWLQSSSSW